MKQVSHSIVNSDYSILSSVIGSGGEGHTLSKVNLQKSNIIGYRKIQNAVNSDFYPSRCTAGKFLPGVEQMNPMVKSANLSLTYSSTSRYPNTAAAKSAALVWKPVSERRKEASTFKIDAIFVSMHLIGLHGGTPRGLLVSFQASLPTFMWPFFVVWKRQWGLIQLLKGRPHYAHTTSTPFSYLHDRDDLPISIEREVQS